MNTKNIYLLLLSLLPTAAMNMATAGEIAIIPAGTEVTTSLATKGESTIELLVKVRESSPQDDQYEEAATRMNGCIITAKVNRGAQTSGGSSVQRITIHGERISCKGKSTSIKGFVASTSGLNELSRGVKDSKGQFVVTSDLVLP